MPNKNARRLRQNQTEAELRLWFALRDRRLCGYKFRRQYPIEPYIADFVCVKHKPIVETDGSQHIESLPDAKRTAARQELGWKVVRFWNNDILAETEAVVATILAALQEEE